MAHPIKELAQKTLQANKDHQYALKVYTERLEAELATVDKLLTSAEWDEQDDEADLDAGGFVLVPGSVKPVGPVAHSDLMSKDSPFREDAIRRQRYLELSTTHPMKAKELDALAEAVRTENYRMHAYEAQRRGQNALTSLNQQPQSYFEINKEGIDWERVASKVSSSIASYVQRSAQECEIRWLGDRHPQINHSAWSDTEVAQAKVLAANYPDGRVDWVKVAEQLGTNRMAMDCMRNVIPRKAHVWTTEADNRLLEAIKMYGIESWLLVARYVSEDATAQQCQNRYYRTLDPDLARGPWTEEEDTRLRRAVEAYGHSWLEVAACVPGRSNEQCRDRWSERLNPKVTKGKWTEEEDKALLEAVGRVGEKWKEISEVLASGRTDKMCRARYEKLKKEKDRKEASKQVTKEVAKRSRTWRSLQFKMAQGSGQDPEPGPSRTNEGLEPLIELSTPPPPPLVLAPPRPKPRPKRKGKEVETAPVEYMASRSASTADDEAGQVASSTVDEPSNEHAVAITTGATKRSRKKAAPAQDTDVPAPKRRRSTKKTQAAAAPVAIAAHNGDANAVGTVDSSGQNINDNTATTEETPPVTADSSSGKGKAKAPPKPRGRPRKKKDAAPAVNETEEAQVSETAVSNTQDTTGPPTSTDKPTPVQPSVMPAASEPPVDELEPPTEPQSPQDEPSNLSQETIGPKPKGRPKKVVPPARAGTRRSTRLR